MRNSRITVIGNQYATRSNALRAIRIFRIRFFAIIPKGFQFWVNRIDNECHEVEGKQI